MTRSVKSNAMPTNSQVTVYPWAMKGFGWDYPIIGTWGPCVVGLTKSHMNCTWFVCSFVPKTLTKWWRIRVLDGTKVILHQFSNNKEAVPRMWPKLGTLGGFFLENWKVRSGPLSENGIPWLFVSFDHGEKDTGNTGQLFKPLTLLDCLLVPNWMSCS